MDCHDVRVLTTVVWPHLTQLELRYSKTPDVQSVSQLANATHLQLPSLDLSYSKIDSCLVAVLLAVPYPNLKSLYLAGNNLTTSMMYLADAHLPLLEELELRNSKLDAQSMAALSRGSWLQLKTLTLADNLIHTPGMQYLAGGNWPPLEAINLSNTGLCGSAMAMLLCGNWPCLQNLGLNGNYMHRMRNLPDFSQYSLLKHLHLNNSDLDHYSLQQLSKARWCQLGTVDLSNNMIESKWACSSFVASHERNPAGWQSTSSTCHSMFVSRGLAFAGALVPLQVTHLLLLLAVCTFLPVSGATVYLRSSSSTIGHLARHWENINFWFSRSLLYLCRLHLDEAALLHLSKGNWPCLKKLDMCNNEQPLSSKAISHLSDAKWPLLEWLCLTNNGFRKAGVLTELSKADWPLLKTLQVSNMLHAAATSCNASEILLHSDLTLSS